MKHSSDINILLVGGGEIGASLAKQLSSDGYKLTIIDREESVVNTLSNSIDAICLQGNGASYATLQEANSHEADILIAVTDSDELNILSCLTSHMLGTKHTVARIREIDYSKQSSFYRDKIGISMIINPELATAMEINRLLRFPLATRVEIFAKGRAELVEMSLERNNIFCGRPLVEITQNLNINLLVCAIARNGNVFVPNGETIIQTGDILYLTGGADEFRKLFKKLSPTPKDTHSVLIAGGGRIAYYLAGALITQKVNVTIVEIDKENAKELADILSDASIICDDALAYFDSMSLSDIRDTDAFIALTDNDEYNLVAAMYAESQGIRKVVSRINAKSLLKVLSPESRIRVVCREDVAADRILAYCRSLLNAKENNAMESLYRLMDGKLEFLEFKVTESTKNINIPIKNLNLKNDMLIACIIRDVKTIIPRGDNLLRPGDRVLVTTLNSKISSFEDIFVES